MFLAWNFHWQRQWQWTAATMSTRRPHCSCNRDARRLSRHCSIHPTTHFSTSIWWFWWACCSPLCCCAIGIAAIKLCFTAIWWWANFREFFLCAFDVFFSLKVLFANIITIAILFALSQFAWLFRYRVSFCSFSLQFQLNSFWNPFVYFFHRQLIMFFYTDACQLLTPLWMSELIYAPLHLHTVAYPALHFCIMLERLRATERAENYESEGHRLACWMCAGIVRKVGEGTKCQYSSVSNFKVFYVEYIFFHWHSVFIKFNFLTKNSF